MEQYLITINGNTLVWCRFKPSSCETICRNEADLMPCSLRAQWKLLMEAVDAIFLTWAPHYQAEQSFPSFL